MEKKSAICPLLSSVHQRFCKREKCEFWVELTYRKKKVARCSLAWLAILSTEIREAIEKMKGGEKK